MTRIVSVHSFRGGTGKSNITANLATLVAKQGKRVGVIDTDIASPGIHILFRFDEAAMKYSLNDHLYGKCRIEQAAYDVTDRLGEPISGKVFLVPASIKPGEIVKFLREGYDPEYLNDGYEELIKAMDLDLLMVDTHPGMNEETLLSMAISDILVIVMRPDQQDYQGTAVTVEVARRLDVPRLMLVINKTPSVFDPDQIRAQAEQTYNAEVAAVLPHSDQMMVLQSDGIFALQHPEHPMSRQLDQLAHEIMET